MQRFFTTLLFATFVMTVFGSVSSPGKRTCYGFDMGRSSLTKLQGVLIGVNDLPDALKGTFTKEDIITDIKDELADDNIKIMTPKESLFSPGAPALLLTIGLVKSDCPSGKDSTYFYAIDLAVSQGVLLSRDENIGLHVDTWKTEDMGTISKLAQVRERIRPVIQKFVASYTAANDKEGRFGGDASIQPTRPSNASKFVGKDSSPSEDAKKNSADISEKGENK